MAVLLFGSYKADATTFCASINNVADIVVTNDPTLVGSLSCNVVYPATATNLLGSGFLAGYLSGGTITGFPYQIIFDGSFNVNAHIGFASCSLLRFTPGSDMTQSNNKNLSISHCDLRPACTAMWSGIFNGQSGTLTLDANTIIGMIDGVTVSNDAPVSCTSNDFQDNYYGMKIENASSNPYSGAVIMDNEFSTSSGLIAPYLGQPAEIGIWVSDCVHLLIGDNTSASGGNSFHDMNNGIYLSDLIDASIIEIWNNSFNDITGATGGSAFTNTSGFHYRGVGIYGASNGSAIVAAYSGASSVFADCDKGIVLSGLNSRIFELTMNGLVWGIALNGGYHYVASNSLEDVFYGIDVVDNTTPLDVSDNTIVTQTGISINPWGSTTFDFPIGIDVSPYGTSAGTYTISDNEIEVIAERGIGIQATDDEFDIESNYISVLPPSQYGGTAQIPLQGIHLDNTDNSLIKYNTIIGNSDALAASSCSFPVEPCNVASCSTGYFFEASGIFMDRSLDMEVECNKMESLAYGFHVVASCATAAKSILTNHFNDHQIGIFMRPGPSTDPQIGQKVGDNSAPKQDNNNEFLGSYYQISSMDVKVYRAMACSTNCPSNNKRFYVWAPTTTLATSESITNSFTSTCEYGVTPVTGTVAVPTCTTYASMMMMMSTPEYEIDTAEMENTILGQTPFIGSFAASQWLDEKALYERLYDHPDVQAATPLIDSFFTAASGTSYETMRVANEAISLLSDTAICLHSVLYAQAIDDATQANDNISPDNQMETNEQDINAAYLKYKAQGIGSLDEDDRALISSLAFACPYEGGTAVYKARMLYRLYGDNAYFNDDLLCSSQGGSQQQRQASQHYHQKESIKVFPNPSSGRVTVSYTLKQESKSLVFELQNMLGQVVLKTALQGSQHETSIDLSALNNGIYYYLVVEDGRVRQSGKIVLNK